MYYGVDNTKAICHWKYVRREKKNGKYRYYYDMKRKREQAYNDDYRAKMYEKYMDDYQDNNPIKHKTRLEQEKRLKYLQTKAKRSVDIYNKTPLSKIDTASSAYKKGRQYVANAIRKFADKVDDQSPNKTYRTIGLEKIMTTDPKTGRWKRASYREAYNNPRKKK